MCGIAGIYRLSGEGLPDFDPSAVLESIRHRGPDDEGTFRDNRIFLGATRLAIIDPAAGRQPVADESGRFHLVMNGEIFGYESLMADLKSRGHRFRSGCDTEVACHLFEEAWAGALDRIDGQFAIAAYDSRENKLLLARDRMGISPLFYAVAGPWLVFASEMKAIFATGLVRPEIRRRGLDAVLAFGCVPAPGTMFEGVRLLSPGKYLEVSDGRITERTFWDIPYPDAGQYPQKSENQWAEEFREVFAAACRRRLRADVPVGLYLSGGIDSASVAAMVAGAGDINKRVFTISFAEPAFDERPQTESLARFLNLQTHVLTYRQSDLARDLPRLIYHAETPILSTESVPLMALSGLARQYAKVVLTGEGSDEALGGYVYFRAEALRQGSRSSFLTPLSNALIWLVFRLGLGKRNPFSPQQRDVAWANEMFGCYPLIMMKFLYFRMVRELVCSEDALAAQATGSDAEFLDLPREKMLRWDATNRTMYLASRMFLAGHLLAAHGDRALMANSVEGRYPFLDREVQEFLATVPPAVKSGVFTGKRLLRKAMKGLLPAEVVARKKKPFLAPFGTPFVGRDATEYIRDLLTPAMLRRTGYFDGAKVGRIVAFLEEAKESVSTQRFETMSLGRAAVERTLMGMALTFVVSTQILADTVGNGFRMNRAGVEKKPDHAIVGTPG